MKDLLVDKFVAAFKQEFISATVLVKKVDTGDSQIHSVFVGNLDAKVLKNEWVRITNFIAIQYQSNLNSDFERWNLYLFFLITDEKSVSDDLKYTIENNTFSSRKIIEDASLSAELLIKKHVNNELTINEDVKRTEYTDFTYDPLIYNVLKEKKLKNKKILSKSLEDAYAELIIKIKGNS